MTDLIHELGLLLLAHHALILLETTDDARAGQLIAAAAQRKRLPHYVWRVHTGLCLDGKSEANVPRTIAPHHCLEEILKRRDPAIYNLQDLDRFIELPVTLELLKDVHTRFSQHAGAVFFSGEESKLPPDIEERLTRVAVKPPSSEQRWKHVLSVLFDLGRRFDFDVDMKQQDARRLVDLLGGMSMLEIDKIISRSVVETGRFDESTVENVRDTKAQMLSVGGVVEYISKPPSMEQVAGMRTLSAWLKKRAALLNDEAAAREFSLEAPKGILLLGVPGCGKSLCAKAIAGEWKLPLLRLDAGSLFGKYLGESEANLRRAFGVAASMAPTVLWIDEIEKAFGSGGDDNATSRRVFGAFLQWMQEKPDSIFVVATANDVSKLPPELLRKGRFDEIFFVDLPIADVREQIFRVHLKLRGRDPSHFDLRRLAEASAGFSGSEIEQAVISGLYTAFAETSGKADPRELTTEHLVRELEITQPLSVTRAESVQALRSWAADRAVGAD